MEIAVKVSWSYIRRAHNMETTSEICDRNGNSSSQATGTSYQTIFEKQKCILLSNGRPIMMYAPSAQGNCAQSMLNNSNKTLRIIVMSHWYVCNTTLRRDLRIEIIAEFVRRQIQTTYGKAHDKELIRNMANYGSGRMKWHKSLRIMLLDNTNIRTD